MIKLHLYLVEPKTGKRLQEAWSYGVIKNNQKVNLTYSQSESLFEAIKNKKINL